MEFFKGFNLARFIIVASLIAAAVLGFQIYGRQQRVDDYHAKLGLGPDSRFMPAVEGQPETMSWVEKKVRSIQNLGRDFKEKTRQLEGEGLNGEDTPQSYIRSQAIKPRVAIGSLSITPNKRRNRGYTDNEYSIVPESDDRGKPSFERTLITNFFFSLESNSSRVKVTALEIKSPGKRNFEDYPNDKWEFTCKLTERVKDE